MKHNDIKRIIFDLDNTLIEWKKEYDDVIVKALDATKYEYMQELRDAILKALDKYETDIKYYNKKEMLDFINKECKTNLPIEFIEEWLKYVVHCVPNKADDNLIKTLEYLNEKYELVVLTNWYGESQEERLKNAGIYKYFKKIYDGEKYAKPHKEAFLQALDGHMPSECAMVGDNLNIDIKPAQAMGFGRVIWKDNKNKKSEYQNELTGIDVITDLKELNNIL